MMTFIDVLILKLDDRELSLLHHDFAKAFDEVPHGQLNGMLENSGLGGKLLKRFCFQNSNRKQLVSISCKKSDENLVSDGVYQASN